MEVVPKHHYREGDTPSHLTVLKLPSVAPPRTLPEWQYPMESRFTLLAQDVAQMADT